MSRTPRLASPEAAAADQEPGPAQAAGSGLRGMSERLAAIGGRLSLGHADAGDRGFRLVAIVPEMPAPTPDEEARLTDQEAQRTDEDERGEGPPRGTDAAGPGNGAPSTRQGAGQRQSTAARPE